MTLALIAVILVAYLILRAFRATTTALIVVVGWAVLVGPVDANVVAWVVMVCFVIDVVVLVTAPVR